MCAQVCPQKIISMSKDITVRGYYYAQVHDPSRCIGCQLCAIMCPDIAIEVHVHGTIFNLVDYQGIGKNS